MLQVCNKYWLSKVFIFLVSVLSGCVSHEPKPPQPYIFDDLTKNGAVVFSIKYNGPNSGYGVQYRGLDNELHGSLQAGVGVSLIPVAKKGDFKYSTGKLHILELPAGKYEFYSWSTKSGMANLSKNKPFSIEFTVEPGRSSYLGSFIFSATSQFGATVTGVRLDYANALSEDLEALYRKYNNVEPNHSLVGKREGLLLGELGGKSNLSWSQVPVLL